MKTTPVLISLWLAAAGMLSVGSSWAQAQTPAGVAPADANQKAALASIEASMVVIPAGSFTMGSPVGEADRGAEEGPQHNVKVAAFSLGKTEVTQAQWVGVMGYNPSGFPDCGPTCPIENVSWEDVQVFISTLNQQSGKTYRLPSEAEWEYAARAGTSGRWSFGENETLLSQYAWFDRNSGSHTHPVGQKQANPLGLVDLHGNVWEWVQDCWNGNYNGAPSTGAAWLSGNCSKRVQRGGDWGVLGRQLHSATRSAVSVTNHYFGLGFRLARN
jgi:formylglycine-generating enzyme required for sulfatase activity